jgi:LPS sulfotransferase NodH
MKPNHDPRVGEFRRNEKLEALLKELNGLLATCQEEVSRRYDRPRFPVLLLMGAPHSGTTLFMQWLAESGRWGYPTNVISRFYAAPYIGARIQQTLIENDIGGEISDFKKTSAYTSTMGKTTGALAPHEFWYFWRRFFPLYPEADVVPPEALARVDLEKLNRELASLEAAMERPLALKAMLLNWHIPFLDAAFEKVLFVHLKRDPAYVVQSMLEGRQRYFGNEHLWYSFKPPEYAWLKDLPPVEQVAGQIHFIRQATEAGMAQVAPARACTVRYEDFCRDPAAAWSALTEKMAGLGCPLNPAYDGPRTFDAANTVRVSPERWEEIRAALKNMAGRE